VLRIVMKTMHTTLFAAAIVLTAFAIQAKTTSTARKNPLFKASTLPFHAPPFDKIKTADYKPAIEAGMKEQLAEVKAIADNNAAPTFANTIEAMEKSGALGRIPMTRSRRSRPRSRRNWRRITMRSS